MDDFPCFAASIIKLWDGTEIQQNDARCVADQKKVVSIPRTQLQVGAVHILTPKNTTIHYRDQTAQLLWDKPIRQQDRVQVPRRGQWN
jgi:hypothetical protein